MEFEAVYCMDGSGGKSPCSRRKRPLYQFLPRSSDGQISRCLLGKRDALDFLVERAGLAGPGSPILFMVDLPIGLPDGFPEVYRGHAAFLPWLSEQGARLRRDHGGDWKAMLVARSVAEQSAEKPFVDGAKTGDKARGRFPLRRCERLTNGESLYWCVYGKQVGKAALQFWFEVLLPLRERLRERVAVWPFEETAGKAAVVAECYPAILIPLVWGRRVVKTDPVDVVEAVHGMVATPEAGGTDERARLHAVSSEDEFDMFTTALAVRRAVRLGEDVLASPEESRLTEGWMLYLSQRQLMPPRKRSRASKSPTKSQP